MSFAVDPQAGYTDLMQDGTRVPFNVGGFASKVQSLTCTANAGALTFTLAPCVLDFRSSTLTDGSISTVKINTPITLTLPSGGTLGSVSTILAQIVLVVINNNGVGELAVVNMAGGNDLSERGLLTTVAIGAGSTANNVVYSGSVRTGVAYRVVGQVDAVNTTGSWATPSLVQGSGGNALSAMSSLGYGQKWTEPTRSASTIYYNTSGKPIHVAITSAQNSGNGKLYVDGILVSWNQEDAGSWSNFATAHAIIPNGSYYQFILAGSSSLQIWKELR